MVRWRVQHGSHSEDWVSLMRLEDACLTLSLEPPHYMSAWRKPAAPHYIHVCKSAVAAWCTGCLRIAVEKGRPLQGQEEEEVSHAQ